MEDLISRSALIEEMERQIKDTENEPDNEAKFVVAMCGQSFIETIKRQPTAYNVNKVVERICNVRNNTPNIDFKNGCNACIDEILGGGKQ